jgi:hypothetical protein
MEKYADIFGFRNAGFCAALRADLEIGFQTARR